MEIESVLPRDAIPSIDDPTFGESYEGRSDDEVLVVEGTPPRAYPVRILNFHEIVNDVVDGDPIAVTWCPLCGSAIVYERFVDGRTLTFGVSGKLADDDLVMYDRETESEWKQSLGECIAGELEGTTLSVRPASMLTYETFTSLYPNGIVLQPADVESEAASETDEPAPVDYSMDPYESYFDADGFGLSAHRHGESDRSWEYDELRPKTAVLGIEIDGEAIGVPYPWVLAAGGVVSATVGSTDVIVFGTDAGMYAYEDPGYTFERIDGRFVGDDTEWVPETGRSADDRRLEPVPTKRLFAFAWRDDHGDAAFLDPR